MQRQHSTTKGLREAYPDDWVVCSDPLRVSDADDADFADDVIPKEIPRNGDETPTAPTIGSDSENEHEDWLVVARSDNHTTDNYDSCGLSRETSSPCKTEFISAFNKTVSMSLVDDTAMMDCFLLLELSFIKMICAVSKYRYPIFLIMLSGIGVLSSRETWSPTVTQISHLDPAKIIFENMQVLGHSNEAGMFGTSCPGGSANSNLTSCISAGNGWLPQNASDASRLALSNSLSSDHQLSHHYAWWKASYQKYFLDSKSSRRTSKLGRKGPVYKLPLKDMHQELVVVSHPYSEAVSTEVEEENGWQHTISARPQSLPVKKSSAPAIPTLIEPQVSIESRKVGAISPSAIVFGSLTS